MAEQREKRHPRRLQIFSLDPSADVRLDTAMISRCTLRLDWEDVSEGPIGDYVEVIDYDPASGCAYDPVNLNDLLATDGLAPSTGNPQFHQQMVYAIVMLTINNFERVLGRRVTWSDRKKDAAGKYIDRFEDRFVQRLRVYPHAIRQQNAFYSPAKKALLMGYFNAPTKDPRDELPGGLVFTCLSHDIIAHETTHAILDGIYPRLLDASNDDMLAFHEAFADVVAIFQHFTLPGLLLDQVQKTRGDLARNNLLVQLASQFARSTGSGDALRNALGTFDELGQRDPPDPSEYQTTTEPHARGAILVAAVFDAFLRIYESRVADLYRIATEGTGVLPEGDIHPDLASRFAGEAVKAANRVLRICIRAVDYLPPVDVTFGDYLRALITADTDMVPDDPRRYRLAFIESFRERGIYPLDVRTLSEESLCWSPPSEDEADVIAKYFPPPSVLRMMVHALEGSDQYVANLERKLFGFLRSRKWGLYSLERIASEFLSLASELDESTWSAGASAGERRDQLNRYKINKAFCILLHKWFVTKAKEAYASDGVSHHEIQLLQWSLGLDLTRLAEDGKVEVHALRPTTRVRPDGRTKTELLMVLTQKHFDRLYDDEGNAMKDGEGKDLMFKFRGGCTLIIDPDDGKVEYAISKCLTSERRKRRHEAFLQEVVEKGGDEAVTRFGLTKSAAEERRHLEPLSFIHTHDDQESWGLY